MKTYSSSFLRRAGPRRQRGVAAVELAIILCMTFFMLPALLLFARFFMQYNIVREATHDAASYLATLPRSEMQNPTKYSAARNIAEDMVIQAAAAAGMLGASTVDGMDTDCTGGPCGSGTGIPQSITVESYLAVIDWSFSNFNNNSRRRLTDDDMTWKIHVVVTLPYTN